MCWFKDDWNLKAGQVSNNCKTVITINKNLELINHQALNRFDELKFTGNPFFTTDELVNKLKGKDEKPTLLIELKGRNKELSKKVNVDITHATMKNMKEAFEI